MRLVFSSRKQDKLGIILIVSVSLPSLFPLSFIKIYVQTDMYEDLILDQLQKSNSEGVKSYGLAPNDIIYT